MCGPTLKLFFHPAGHRKRIINYGWPNDIAIYEHIYEKYKMLKSYGLRKL